MKATYTGDVPRYYSLSIDTRLGHPVIKVDKHVLWNCKPFPKKHVDENRKANGFLKRRKNSRRYEVPYTNTPKQYFGYNRSIVRLEDEGEFNVFLCILPKIRRLSNEPCAVCAQSDQYSTCDQCDGTGYTPLYNFVDGYITCASIQLFLQMIHTAYERLHCRVSKKKEKQLLVLQTGSDVLSGAFPIRGRVSRFLVETMQEMYQPPNFISVLQAMEKAYRIMWHMPNNRNGKEHAVTQKLNVYMPQAGRFVIQTIGDDCKVVPSEPLQKGCGYLFTSHHVDTPLQQLTLFTGLAALCDLVERM